MSVSAYPESGEEGDVHIERAIGLQRSLIGNNEQELSESMRRTSRSCEGAEDQQVVHQETDHGRTHTIKQSTPAPLFFKQPSTTTWRPQAPLRQRTNLRRTCPSSKTATHNQHDNLACSRSYTKGDKPMSNLAVNPASSTVFAQQSGGHKLIRDERHTNLWSS